MLLQSGELHLWSIDLDRKDWLSQNWRVLSESERERAGKFKFERDRNRYVRAHAALRDILSRYVGVAPNAISFSFTPEGKPYVDGFPREGQVTFSLTHSQGVGVVGLAWNKEIGVDIEALVPVADALSVASQFFHRDETQSLQLLPQDSLNEAFLRLWTRKEAFVKCRGLGLSLPLNSFSVLDSAVTKEYVLASVPLSGEFVGSVVYPSPPLLERLWVWNDDTSSASTTR